MVEKILATQGEDALLQASTDSLKSIVNITHQDSTTASLGVSGKIGMGPQAGGSLGKNWNDQTVTDAIR